MAILNNTNSSIQGHKITFHVFISSSISFINDLKFSNYKSFISLIKFILRYFILFDVILNGIILLFCLSHGLLLIYRKVTNTTSTKESYEFTYSHSLISVYSISSSHS